MRLYKKEIPLLSFPSTAVTTAAFSELACVLLPWRFVCLLVCSTALCLPARHPVVVDIVDVSILVVAVVLYVLFVTCPLFARVLIIDIILFCFAAKFSSAFQRLLPLPVRRIKLNSHLKTQRESKSVSFSSPTLPSLSFFHSLSFRTLWFALIASADCECPAHKCWIFVSPKRRPATHALNPQSMASLLHSFLCRSASSHSMPITVCLLLPVNVILACRWRCTRAASCGRCAMGREKAVGKVRGKQLSPHAGCIC